MTKTYHDKAQEFIKSSKSKGYQVKAEGEELIAYPPGTPKPNFKDKVKNAIHSILSFPGKMMDGVEGRMKEQDEYIKNRDDKMKTENWGSPENYDKLQQKGAMKKLIKAPKLDKVEPLKMKKLIPLKEMNKKPVGKI